MTKTNAQAKTANSAKVTKAAKTITVVDQFGTKAKVPAAKPAKAKALTAAEKDVIAQSKAANPQDSTRHMLVSKGGEVFTFPTQLWVGGIRELSVMGKSFSQAVKAIKALPQPEAKLANGVNGHNAPHSSKAIADQRAKATNKADAATQKAPTAKAKVEAKKADKAKAKEASKGDRSYMTMVNLADITLRPDTWTKVMVETALTHTSTDAANAALAKNRTYGDRKIDWKWLADTRKYIKFA